MESEVEKKKARITREDGGGEEEDRISRLSDELLHKVVSFIDTKWAVQTSVLSKRWKLVWTTLPFLKFRWVESGCGFYGNTDKVALHVLTNRNHQAPISSLDLMFLPRDLIGKFLRFSREKLKEYYQQFPYMLARLRNAKILNLDLEAFQALSLISDFLEYFPSPFSNLKYVKLPHGRTETSISSTLRSFLIDGSPTATILTTLPQNNMIPQIAAAAITTQNVVPQKPSAAPIKVLVDSEIKHKAMCIDTVDVNVAQNSALSVDKARQIGAPVERTGNDQASNSRGDRDFGFWRGHKINSEFVCLLDLIMYKYPETFEHFTTKNKKFSTMKLNMLCASVIYFTKISMSEVDTELIAESRDVFAGLQQFGFNLSWLMNRLNYVEKLRFSLPLAEMKRIECRIIDAKTKLQDLQTLRAEKMQEIQKAFGIMVGTNLDGCIGDDLLPGL